MDRNNNTYRESLIKWFEEIEKMWETNRTQLLKSNEEQSLKQWESAFLSLKKEVENQSDTKDNKELYNKINVLYDKLKGFYNRSQHETMEIQVVPIGGHQLPPLPYSYEALEPVISKEIMWLHHTKHHQSYVDGLNKAEKQLQNARETGNFDLIKHWERELAFHGAGHYLHTIFWTIMTPGGGGQPTGSFRNAIDDAFGSFEKFKMQFSKAAENVEGGGWAILVWSPRSHRLEILTAEKHQNLTQWDVIPLLVLDVWEHAYYLQYKNVRAKYIENWWSIVNWNEVEQRFNKARTLMWQPF